MQMVLCYAERQEYKCYIVWREPESVYGERVSTWRCSLPLLWSLVVDDLLWELNSKGHFTVGYAADIAILINGKLPYTMSEVLQTALHTLQQWCKRTNLSINPNKMVIIPFTRKRDIKGLKEPILFSQTIWLSSELKYLGIKLDMGLT